MLKTILCLFLLVPFSSGASDWTSSDTKLEAVYHTFALIDLLQTVGEKPKPLSEANPYLVDASNKKIVAYFITTSMIHYTISRNIPVKYRPSWQYLTIGIEGGQVVRNVILRIQLNVPLIN